MTLSQDGEGQEARRKSGPSQGGHAAVETRIRFRVASVEKTEVPSGALEAYWYRYVVENGYTCVTGFRAGSLQEVREHAEQVVGKLNARSYGTSGGWGRRGYGGADRSEEQGQVEDAVLPQK